MSSGPLISIVSPVYRAENVLDQLVEEIKYSVSSITKEFEVILVDDGSPDSSWEKIKKQAQKDDRIKGFRLSRNFGQHYAITAGLNCASGQYIVVMDCDLQDDPKYIKPMYDELLKGHDLVYTIKNRRSHNFLKNMAAKLFYRMISFLGGYRLDPLIGNYSILSRKVVQAFLMFNDYQRGYLFILQWLGFSSSHLRVHHRPRSNGKSSYNYYHLFKQALGLTIGFSDRLLYFSIISGLFIGFLSFIGILIIIYRYLFYGYLEGWPSLIVAQMFFSGLILISLGIIGLYLGKTFEQAKQRPLFLISEKVNA